MAAITFPKLLDAAPSAERLQWKRWIIDSHSDQFLPEMAKKPKNLKARIQSQAAGLFLIQGPNQTI